MALFLVVVVLLGFGPSFYLRGIVPAYPRPNPTLPPAVMLHGLMFTLWMACWSPRRSSSPPAPPKFT